MSAHTISFVNSLDFSIVVYDSFSDQDKTNYFGTLTPIATVRAKSTASLHLLHPASVLIASNATSNSPLARIICLQDVSTGPFGVSQADVDAMLQTMDFIAFIISNDKDPLTLAFKDLWKDTSKSQVKAVNQFFAQHKTYAKCSFATYMMAITYTAELPEVKGKPMDQAVYSLSTLAKLLGGTWPDFLPDIVVTKFTCNTDNDVLAIKAMIDLKKLPAQSDAALQFFGSLFNVQQIQVAVSFNHGFSLGVLGTRLSISLDAMHVPFGGSSTLTINKPTATIDINPLFKFIVFTVTGEIPFNIFGKQFDADVSMVIDNIEANFGVVIKGDKTSLPAPPVMKGVHFDTFGVGIGIMFEPPSAVIGLSGQLHIGEPGTDTLVALNDDKFVVVCQVIEEVPNPLYISFYIPQMHLTDVFTVFTDLPCPVDVPVLFTDLSFKWSENPMEPVALPDGTLSSMGYGFSAAAEIFDFSFYGDVEIDLTNGVKADIEMAPLSLGSIFSIKGDGTGVSIKVDANGNPIKNNQLLIKAEQKQALQNSTMKQLVVPGGPVLKIQTTASPFLHLNGAVSLFEVENLHVEADITSSGIAFEVGFGGLLTSNMSCTVSDFHNLSAAFQFGINDTISLPSISGVSLGSIPLEALVGAHFALNTSSSDIVLSVGGSFDFEGLTRNFGDFTVDVNIQSVSDMLSAIVKNIEDNAAQIFGDLLNEAGVWANKVKQEVITGVNDVANVLQNAFNQSASEVASTMRGAGFEADEIANGLRSAFGMTGVGIAQAMQQVGYTGQDVARALQSVFGNDPAEIARGLQSAFGMAGTDIARTMQQVGYTGQQVASALQGVFGNDAGQIATALKDGYGLSVDQINGVLGSIGFNADQIGQAFQSLGDAFKDFGNSLLDGIGGIFHL
ncbi:uncharacterized protein FTOL_10552 [Fusarium torulosum]|uniref:Uncharacterized protein n=1 Tax=Fusarium torulosum TaxID=33205 RepID=A0AAE8MIA0_9HYPO|nr:uncharacterized protein FTOL_10552 [Fusarium torulosum]